MSNRSSHTAGPDAQRDSADDAFSGFEEDPLVELARIVSEGNSRLRKEEPQPVEAPAPDEVDAGGTFAEDHDHGAEVEPDSVVSEPFSEETASLVDHEAWARDLEDGLARDLGFQVGADRAPEHADRQEEAYQDDPYAGGEYGADAYSAEPVEQAGNAEDPYGAAPHGVTPYDDERLADEDVGQPIHAAGFPEEDGYHQDYGVQEPGSNAGFAPSDHQDVLPQTERWDGDQEPYAHEEAPAEAEAYDDEGIHAGGAYERALEEAVAASVAARQLASGRRQAELNPADREHVDDRRGEVPRTLTDDLAASLENEFLTQPAAPRHGATYQDEVPDEPGDVQSSGWPQGSAWEEPVAGERQGDDRSFDDDFLLQPSDPPLQAGAASTSGDVWTDEHGYSDDPYAQGDAEAPPPPGGYDLDAVAQAMRESDPHLGGHGVLPPHSDAELEAAPAHGKSRRGLVVAAAVMGIVVLGGGAFALLDLGGGAPDGPPRIITASDEPVKEFPENEERPGNGASKLIYDRVGGGEGTSEERLVLRDETPVASLPPAPAGQVSGENGTVVPAGPRRVRTVVVRPDGTIISGSDADTSSGTDQGQSTGQAPVQAPTVPGATAGVTASGLGQGQQQTGGNTSSDGQARVVSTSPVSAAPSGTGAGSDPASGTGTGAVASGQNGQAAATADAPVNVPRTKPDDIQTLARSAAPPPAVQSQPVSQQRSAAPLDLTASAGPQAPVASPQATPSASSSGTIPAGAYVVQVSSQRSEQQAQTAFDDLQRRFGSVLGGVSPVIQRADLGDRGTFYRVRIPTSSRDEAISLCERLKTAGGDCFVRRN
jgi:hypothetical protein